MQKQKSTTFTIAAFLKSVDIEASTSNIFKVRLFIFILCLMIILFIYLGGQKAGDEFGNYNEMKELYPDLIN
jgi:putative Mn2+ efflux pump MntP